MAVVVGGSNDAEFLKPSSGRNWIAARRHFGIGEQDGELPLGVTLGELSGGGQKGETNIGCSVTLQGKEVRHDGLWSTATSDRLELDHTVTERKDREPLRRSPRAHGSGESGAGQPSSIHRTRAIDQKTDGGIRFLPLGSHEVIEIRRLA